MQIFKIGVNRQKTADYGAKSEITMGSLPIIPHTNLSFPFQFDFNGHAAGSATGASAPQPQKSRAKRRRFLPTYSQSGGMFSNTVFSRTNSSALALYQMRAILRAASSGCISAYSIRLGLKR